jgi:hypothetical protein
MLGALSGPALAQEPAEVEIEKVTCRDLMLMFDDQESTLVYYHGFISGKKGEMLYKEKELIDATSKIIEYCVDNPTSTVLSAFEKFR